MSSISITRRNPKTGRTETPFKEHGWYVLGDPANGSQKHHKHLAVRVRTLEEVVDLLKRGFSLRMSDGRTTWPPLISPKSLEISVAGESYEHEAAPRTRDFAERGEEEEGVTCRPLLSRGR